MNYYPKRVSIILLLSVVVLMISIGCTTSWDKHEVMIKEYNLIMPYPEATRVNTSSGARLNGSAHGAYYQSRASWVSLRAHYSEQLEQNGWTKVDEGLFPQGDKCLSYKKDDLRAFLQFASVPTNWNFSFGLSWSLSQSCQ
jgi:hypothetical protein